VRCHCARGNGRNLSLKAGRTSTITEEEGEGTGGKREGRKGIVLEFCGLAEIDTKFKRLRNPAKALFSSPGKEKVQKEKQKGMSSIRAQKSLRHVQFLIQPGEGKGGIQQGGISLSQTKGGKSPRKLIKEWRATHP